jgi:hypothetical protein
VVQSALQNAASVASLLLTTEAMVVDKPEEDKNGAGMPPMPPRCSLWRTGSVQVDSLIISPWRAF